MAEQFTSNQITSGDQVSTWAALSSHIIGLLPSLDILRAHRVMFIVSSELEAVSLVAAGIQAELDFGLIERSRLNDDLKNRLADLGVSLVDLRFPNLPLTAARARDVKPGRICVLTSGTTGHPKLIPHTKNSLNTFDRVNTSQENQWFVPYQVGSYAWYQMISLGLFIKDQGLVLGTSSNLMGSFEDALRNRQITAVSSTPTFWRQAAMSVAPGIFSGCNIRSISLGGEIVDQAILDYLKNLFPQAVIKHIYASSETGAAIIVSDGQAGFDAKLITSSTTRPIAVRIVDGQLQVRSRYGATGTVGHWIATGDLVEKVENRIYFRGRADNQMINVGGQKAYPATIEAHLLSHPNVTWAQVIARRAPLVGHLPVANLVLKSNIDILQAEQDLTQFCDAQLPEYAVPRLWNFLDEVPIRDSLKS